ncbi:MAG: hypothetical protein HY924_09480 [Elusimicrobia bacterium]|nr:hypothetical protein [Elusimicrobiota bacterium]
MTLFLLGPFALPFALRSPKLTTNGKWIASGLIAAYGVYLCWSVWRLIQQVRMYGGSGSEEMIHLMMGRP